MEGETVSEDDLRRSERERREAAEEAAEHGVEPGGREVPGRATKQMVSVRLEPELISALRRIADREGVAVSDLLRQAAKQLADEESRQRVQLHLLPSREQWSPISPTRVQITSGFERSDASQPAAS